MFCVVFVFAECFVCSAIAENTLALSVFYGCGKGQEVQCATRVIFLFQENKNPQLMRKQKEIYLSEFDPSRYFMYLSRYSLKLVFGDIF